MTRRSRMRSGPRGSSRRRDRDPRPWGSSPRPRATTASASTPRPPVRLALGLLGRPREVYAPARRLDGVDPHRDLVADPDALAAPHADEGGFHVVDLVALPGHPACREEPLVELGELAA